MRIAIYPGSFDPVTLGHLDVIKAGADLFDKLYVVVMNNPDKKCMYEHDTRIGLIDQIITDIPNVHCFGYSGTVPSCAVDVKAKYVLRSMRLTGDYEYELQLAMNYRALKPELQVVLLPPEQEHMHISSSVVRQLLSLGGVSRKQMLKYLCPETVDKLYFNK